MNVLFYVPLNNRCRNIESQALELKGAGHKVFLLTPHQRAGKLHTFFDEHQFETASFFTSSRFKGVAILRYVVNLVRFCKRNRIDIVFSHVDSANLVAVIAQYFFSTKVIVARHHADVLWLLKDYKNYYLSKLIYKLAPIVEVVSKNAKEWMVDREGVNPGKIVVIPISYNWNLFPMPSESTINEIKNKFKGQLVLCTAARFLSIKRIDHIIEMVFRLRRKKMDIQLLILGDGEERVRLQELVAAKNLISCVHFLGFVDDTLPYLAASDLYVHFSESEASCVSVKEAGLVKTPIMVCQNVGDFDQYLDECTALFVRKNHVVEDGVALVGRVINNPEYLKMLGRNLHDKVKKHFSIENVMPMYNQLIEQ
jgi:glycosyltransferase involved in cell wall biosynthesis